MAQSCVKFCYARKGFYTWSNVNKAHEERYEFSKTDEFVSAMIKDIKRKKADYVRIHDAGDYYSKAYLNKWIEIMKALPNVRFYSYTNMVPSLIEIMLPYYIMYDHASGKYKTIKIYKLNTNSLR